MRFFTTQERFTILFLVFLFVLSTSLYLYKLNHPSFAPAFRIENFDEKMAASTQGVEPVTYDLPRPAEEIPAFYKKKPPPQKVININTAEEAELMKLPGVGPVYAERIIAYRKQNGDFKSIEEIKRIKGIGEKRFLKMKHYISIN